MSGPFDALQWAVSRIEEGHRHHRHCVHNLSAEEQKALWMERCQKYDDPERAYEIIYRDIEPTVITPDDWEIDAPDLDFSRFGGPVSDGGEDRP